MAISIGEPCILPPSMRMSLQPKLLCRRCPPLLNHQVQNKKTKLCKGCYSYYGQLNRGRAAEGLLLLSVDEFIRLHPSRFVPKLCRRCPPSLRRKTSMHGLCKGCGNYFCTLRRKQCEDGVNKQELMSVDEFLEKHAWKPRRKNGNVRNKKDQT